MVFTGKAKTVALPTPISTGGQGAESEMAAQQDSLSSPIDRDRLVLKPGQLFGSQSPYVLFLASSGWNREADGDRSVATQTMQSVGSYGRRRLWPSQKSTTRSFLSVSGMQLVTVSSKNEGFKFKKEVIRR